MKIVCRLLLYIASPWCAAALPLIAHADTDACTLLTPVQVAAAVGIPALALFPVTPALQMTLNLQTAAFYDGGKGHATMAAATGGKGTEMKAASVGDDAYYFVIADQAALFVKKGAVSFKVAVYAKIPMEEKEAMELKLAREVVAKL